MWFLSLTLVFFLTFSLFSKKLGKHEGAVASTIIGKCIVSFSIVVGRIVNMMTCFFRTIHLQQRLTGQITSKSTDKK